MRTVLHGSMSALTPANQLTLLRMLLIPAFALLVIYGYLGRALAVFVAAGLTDALDGVLARRRGQKTALGAWLDPMADKLLLTTSFIVLTLPLPQIVQPIPLWLTVLVISRDIGIVLTVAIINFASGPRTFSPTVLGKIATVLYVTTVAFALLANWLGRPLVVVDVLVYLALAITLLSGLHYLARVTRLLNE